MSIKGSPYPRFQRALKTGNLAVIRNAARELPRVDLADALLICVTIRDQQPETFERATLRWLARFCAERAQTAEEVAVAADAFSEMTLEPEESLATLRRLSREPGDPRRAA